MDFALTEDQRAFQATARQFAREAMMPHAAEWDENEVFPVEALREAIETAEGPTGGITPEERERLSAFSDFISELDLDDFD